jgi:hypothetical protein
MGATCHVCLYAVGGPPRDRHRQWQPAQQQASIQTYSDYQLQLGATDRYQRSAHGLRLG